MALLNRGVCRHMLKQPDAAEQDFSAVIKLAPNDYNARPCLTLSQPTHTQRRQCESVWGAGVRAALIRTGTGSTVQC